MKRSIVISVTVTTALFFGGIGGAKADPPVVHESNDTTPAVKGTSKNGRGVEGWSDANFGVDDAQQGLTRDTEAHTEN
jgi:hypothetical protein